MAKHSAPDDNSFTVSLVRHVAAAVALVAVCAAAFWGIGQVRDDSPGTEIAATPDGGEPAAPETSAPATSDGATTDPTPATPPAGEGTAEPTSEATATDEPSEDASDEPSTDASEDDVATGAGDIDPAEISLQVLDATGGDGSEAEAVVEQLEEDGFNVVATNKAVRVYETTTVFYTPGNEAKAEQIAAMYGYREVAPEPGNLSHSVDVHLVVGTDA